MISITISTKLFELQKNEMVFLYTISMSNKIEVENHN